MRFRASGFAFDFLRVNRASDKCIRFSIAWEGNQNGGFKLEFSQLSLERSGNGVWENLELECCLDRLYLFKQKNKQK